MSVIPVTKRPDGCPFFVVMDNRWLDNRGVDEDTGYSMPDRDGWHMGITTRQFRGDGGLFSGPWSGAFFYVLIHDLDPRWIPVGADRERWGEVVSADRALDIIIERGKLEILNKPHFEALNIRYKMRQALQKPVIERAESAPHKQSLFKSYESGRVIYRLTSP